MCDSFFSTMPNVDLNPAFTLDSYSICLCFLLLYEPRDVHHRLLLWTCTRHLLQLRHHGAIIIRNRIAASILVPLKTQNHQLWIWKPSSISTLDLKTQINFISLGVKPLIFETPKPKLHQLVDFKMQAWWRQIFRKPKASFWWSAKPKHKLP